MKKILASIISVCLVVGVCPVTFANESSEKANEVVISMNEQEQLFLPIVVDDTRATQGNEEIDCIVQEDDIYIDIGSLACENIEVKETKESATIITESEEIELSVDEDVLLEKDDTLYVNLSDVAENCGIKEVKEEEATIYVKPYQTKRLIVETDQKLPDVDASNIIENDENIILEFDTESETEEAYELLSETDSIEQVSGENVYSTYALTDKDFYAGDNLSWGADYVNSPQIVEYAEDIATKEEVVVAVVDTGISTEHSFLQDSIHEDSISVVHGVDACEDDNGHGSHVSGIIVDNTPSNVKILAVKALTDEGVGYDSTLARAINYAVEQGADIINMSWGGYTFWTENCLIHAIKNAYDQGVVLVAAAGNENYSARYYYPASSPYCITVAATDRTGAAAKFSNYGECVTVAAPGVSIKSAYMGVQYEVASGTSMAAPFVAAACATDQTINGKKTPSEMKEHIKCCVTPHKSDSMYGRYGTGILDYSGIVQSMCAEPVLFNYASGYYTDEMEVELSCVTEGAEIYYTLDTVSGSEGKKPTKETGILYTAPIKISESTKIRAVAYCDGIRKSKVTTVNYYFNYYDDEHQYVVDDNGVLTAYNGIMTRLAVPEKIAGETVVEIGKEVFREKEIELVQLPDTVTRIDDYAFYKCKKLQTIIAKGVTQVGERSFYSSTRLETVDMPQLQFVCAYGFYNCSKLMDEGIVLGNIVDVGEYSFAYSGIQTIVAEQLSCLGEKAFYQCGKLFSVFLPSATTIKAEAFKNCGILEYVSIPKAKELGEGIFYQCEKLQTVEMADLDTVPERTFYRCKKLAEIPEGCKNASRIGNYAFAYTDILETEDLNARIIEYHAFSHCDRIECLSFPKAYHVEEQDFGSDASLKEIDYPEALYVEGPSTSTVTSVNLPKCIALGDASFFSCNKLESVRADRVVSIGRNSFWYCYQLKELDFPSLEVVGERVFEYCNRLEKISFPKLRSINRAFSYSEKLRLVNLPSAKEFLASTIHVNSLEYLVLPNCTTYESSILDANSLKEFSLPKAKVFSTKHTNLLTNGGKIDVNVHIPVASKVVLTGESYFSIAIPTTTSKIERSLLWAYFNEPITFYTDNIDLKMPSEIKSYTFETPPVLKTDLPAEKVLTNEDYTLEVSVYSAAPIYQWFYSDDGENYIKINDNNRNRINPNQAGYYYCHISDAQTGKAIDTSVCKVDLQMEMFFMQVECKSPVNAMVGDVLFEKIESGEKLFAPKGTQIQILGDNTFSSVLLNGQEKLECKAADYVFVLSDDTTVKTQCGKLLTSDNFVIDANAYVQGKSLTIGEHNVFYGGKALREGIDYTMTVIYPEMTDKCYYLIEAKGEYEGTIGGEYCYGGTDEIDIKDCVIESIPDQKFSLTSGEIEPPITVRYHGAVVSLKYYTIEYSNNAKPGTGKVKITGKDRLVGSRSVTFQIYMPISSVFKSLDQNSYTYTGEEICPKVYWRTDDIDITAEVEYQDNISVGKGKAIIRGVGAFQGCVTAPFEILGDISSAKITLEHEESVYDGTNICPKVTVAGLEEGKDFKVEYRDNREVGTGKVIVTGQGDYYGAVVKEFKIQSRGLREEDISLIVSEGEEYVYDGTNICPKVTVAGFKEGRDYKVEYRDNKAAGIGKIIVTGIGGCCGTIVKNFQIQPRSLSLHEKDIALSITKYNYQNVAIKPIVQSKNLIAGVDYSLTYKNNFYPGTGTVIITGIGNYKGSVERQFTIVMPSLNKVNKLKIANVSETSIKLTWAKVSGIKGYQVYDAYTKKIVKQVTTNYVTIKGLKAGTKHKYKVRAYTVVNGKTYTGAYSSYVNTATKPKTPKISTAKAKKKSAIVSWKKVTYASGYQIAYSTSSRFKKSSTKYAYVSAKTLKKTIKSLKKGKTYYIKVRAYRSYVGTNGKVTKMYGSFSKVKKVKPY